MEKPTAVESWYFYEEMAKRKQYGDIVTSSGEIVLSPESQTTADFFVKQLKGRSLVIDVGCGLGFPTLIIAPHVRRVVAFDAAPSMVRQLRLHLQRLCYDLVAVVRAWAEALPFERERFDAAVISGALGSLTKPELMLEELFRILQPGAIVVCAVENFAHKLIVDEGKESRCFCMDNGDLSLQMVEYLKDPYRIRNYRYIIRNNSNLYRALLAEYQESISWQTETEMRPTDLPQETVASIIYDEAIQYDPVTLTAAFQRAGFGCRGVELRSDFRVQRIFGSFYKE